MRTTFAYEDPAVPGRWHLDYDKARLLRRHPPGVTQAILEFHRPNDVARMLFTNDISGRATGVDAFTLVYPNGWRQDGSTSVDDVRRWLNALFDTPGCSPLIQKCWDGENPGSEEEEKKHMAEEDVPERLVGPNPHGYPPAQYGWKITGDPDAGSDEGSMASAVGTVGPQNLTEAIRKRLEAGEGEAFRMLDDDGHLVYEGRIIDERGDDYKVPPWESTCFGFEPLDDFGGPNVGCTTIQYRNKQTGKWENL